MKPDTFLFVVHQKCGYSIITTEVTLKVSLLPVFDIPIKFADLYNEFEKISFPLKRFIDFLDDDQMVYCELYYGYRMNRYKYMRNIEGFLKTFSSFLTYQTSLENNFTFLQCNIQNVTPLDYDYLPKTCFPVLDKINYMFEDERENIYLLNKENESMRFTYIPVIEVIEYMYNTVKRNISKFPHDSVIYTDYILPGKLEELLGNIEVARTFLGDKTLQVLLDTDPALFPYEGRVFVRTPLVFKKEDDTDD